MGRHEAEKWMWSEAVDMLARAERLHRQFFQLTGPRRMPVWEPPADVLETDAEALIFVALPGVDPETAEIAIEGGELVISGHRILPPELRDAIIHRLELPQGRFERRVTLPRGRYDRIVRTSLHGCLLLRLNKAD
jgi:HSP20 family molecular chaperone IbpA